jgi:hypothetical protein
MLHASSRRNAIAVAEGEGLKIEKKVRRMTGGWRRRIDDNAD